MALLECTLTPPHSYLAVFRFNTNAMGNPNAGIGITKLPGPVNDTPFGKTKASVLYSSAGDCIYDDSPIKGNESWKAESGDDFTYVAVEVSLSASPKILFFANGKLQPVFFTGLAEPCKIGVCFVCWLLSLILLSSRCLADVHSAT